MQHQQVLRPAVVRRVMALRLAAALRRGARHGGPVCCRQRVLCTTVTAEAVRWEGDGGDRVRRVGGRVRRPRVRSRRAFNGSRPPLSLLHSTEPQAQGAANGSKQEQQKQKQPPQQQQQQKGGGGGGKKGSGAAAAASTSSDEDIRRLRIAKAEELRAAGREPDA